MRWAWSRSARSACSSVRSSRGRRRPACSTWCTCRWRSCRACGSRCGCCRRSCATRRPSGRAIISMPCRWPRWTWGKARAGRTCPRSRLSPSRACGSRRDACAGMADSIRAMSLALARRWLRPAPDSAVAQVMRTGKSPWTQAVHLLWSSWIFITPTFNGVGYTLEWVGLTLLSYPIFLALYVGALVSSCRYDTRFALGMVALCLGLLPWYSSGLSYFVFGCVMLHICRPVPLWRYLAHVLLLNGVLGAACWVYGLPLQILAWMLPTTLIVGIVVNVERANEERDAALRLSQDEVRRLAATAERERIGRDLHDLLGHTLSLITLKLELARKLFDRDPAAGRVEIAEAEKVARLALSEVRSAVTGFRAADLAAELAAARLLLESSGVALEYASPPELPEAVAQPLA